MGDKIVQMLNDMVDHLHITSLGSKEVSRGLIGKLKEESWQGRRRRREMYKSGQRYCFRELIGGQHF